MTNRFLQKTKLIGRLRAAPFFSMPKRILVIALSGIGDALMFTPAAKFLRETWPDATIDALVMFGGVNDIYSRTGYFNTIHHFRFLEEGSLRSLRYVMSLRGKYDVSINVYPANRREYNIISQLIGARQRAGVRYLRQDAQNLGFLNNVTVRENDDLHNAEENIALCEKLTGRTCGDPPPYQFPLTLEDEEFAERFIRDITTGGRTVIGFHPGCNTLKNHAKRRWAPGRFAELGRRLISERNAEVLVFGGPEEAELKQEVFEGIGSEYAHIVNSGNMGQSAALIKRSALFVTNDSSLMHVASAMETPTAALIGPTNPSYIRPWKTKHEIVSLELDCAPCFFYSPTPLKCHRTDVAFKCVKELSVDIVLRSVDRLLK